MRISAPPRIWFGRRFTLSIAIELGVGLYVFGDPHYVSAKTMKIIHILKQAAYAVVAVGVLAVALVGLVVGCLLGQPITLFPAPEEKP